MPIPHDVQQVHGITDAMVRGKPTVEQILPRFIEFVGHRDTILLAHNAPFDLGFLGMALTRLGIPCPPHHLFDTLDMTRQIFPTWPSYSLENVAIRLKVANRAEHHALSDARVVKGIFLEMLQHAPIVRTVTDLWRLSPPLTFAHAPVFAIEPPPGFEMLTTAMAERCAITIVYEHRSQRPKPRKITPHLVLEVHGVAYVIAHCHLSDTERTFRLDRIREC
jgi:DNA polymerase III epsilon subunit-like protein